jgi:SAM-dependent methyltransferase
MFKKHLGTIKDIAQWAQHIHDINFENRPSGTDDASVVKTEIASAYSHFAEKEGGYDIWNWGYHDNELQSEILNKIPGSILFTDTFSEQLYYFALSAVPLCFERNLDILEVGCGLGEGLNFLSRLYGAPSYKGIDLCAPAINRAQARLARKGLMFRVADAESMPFDDAAFDILLNVESSHNYPNFEKFVCESARVLRPGGYFAMADVVSNSRLEDIERILKCNSKLEYISQLDVSSNVRTAINLRLQRDSILSRRINEQARSFFTRSVMRSAIVSIMGGDFAGKEQSFVLSGLQRLITQKKKPQFRAASYQFFLFRRNGQS